METKTIAHLNQKIWYRFFKVGFIFFLLMSILIFNGITIYDRSGKVGGINSLQLDDASRTQLDGIMLKMDSQGASDSDMQAIANDFKQKYGKPTYSNSYFIKLFIIGNLFILLFFEILRRVFYYIVLGTIKPEK